MTRRGYLQLRPDERPLMSRAEAAELARCSLSTIDRARRAGVLEEAHANTRVLITRDSVIAWLSGPTRTVMLVLGLVLVVLIASCLVNACIVDLPFVHNPPTLRHPSFRTRVERDLPARMVDNDRGRLVARWA